MSDKDTIYRQEAIDTLFELYEYQRNIDPTEAADLVRQGIYLAEKKIEQLPSAQPERNAEVSKMEIIHCKDCLYKKICSWKNQGAEFCSFGKRGKQDDSD